DSITNITTCRDKTLHLHIVEQRIDAASQPVDLGEVPRIAPIVRDWLKRAGAQRAIRRARAAEKPGQLQMRLSLIEENAHARSNPIDTVIRLVPHLPDTSLLRLIVDVESVVITRLLAERGVKIRISARRAKPLFHLVLRHP